MTPVAEQPLHRALGLTDGELDRIRELLEREPNDFELAVFSLLWSEHCGYKHSALAPEALSDRGAGACSRARARTPASSTSATAWRSRSRSRATTTRRRSSRSRARRPASAGSCATSSPWARGRSRCSTGSASATPGLRDFGRAVGGHRPLRELRRRPDRRRRGRLRRALRATTASSTRCASALLPAERVTRARASGPGNLVVLYGATTGRDGIGGASVLASQELVEARRRQAPDRPDRRPVHRQEADRGEPRARRGRARRVAAGLRRRRPRLLARRDGVRGGAGVDVHLDRVPLREAGMEPVGDHDLREPGADGRRRRARAARRGRGGLRTWELALRRDRRGDRHRASCAASSTTSPSATIPARLLTDECPRYRVETERRASWPSRSSRARRAGRPTQLLELLGSPNIRSRGAGSTATTTSSSARARFAGPASTRRCSACGRRYRGLAVSLDGAGRARARSTRARAGMLAVLEAARNVACAGGRPLAHHRLPQLRQPGEAGDRLGARRGDRGDGARLRGARHPGRLRATSRSTTRPTAARSIPTPVVGCVGLVEDVRPRPGALAGGRRRAARRERRSCASTAPSTRRASSAALAGRPAAARPRRRGGADRIPRRRDRRLTLRARRRRGRPRGRARRAGDRVRASAPSSSSASDAVDAVRRGRRPGGRRLRAPEERRRGSTACRCGRSAWSAATDCSALRSTSSRRRTRTGWRR